MTDVYWTIDADAFEEYLRVFPTPGAVSSGLNYYREVFSDVGRAASRERCETLLDMPILAVGGADAYGEDSFRTMNQVASGFRDVVFGGIGHH